MRIMLIVAWLFTGLGGVIYHYGPGQEKLEVDRISGLLQVARHNAEQEQWIEAVQTFDSALAEMPGDKVNESRAVMLEKAKAQMMAASLPEARSTLQSLLSDMRADEDADPKLLLDVQSTLANSQYYMTWLMRLEGLPEEEWMPEIEAARQHYTQLAKEAKKLSDDKLLETSLEDLESAIRLARMDLSDLQALPLPGQ